MAETAPEKAPPLTRNHTSANSGWSVQVMPADEVATEAYAAFSAGAAYAPAQSPLWANAWLRGGDGLIALLSRRNAPAMALALEIVRKGPYRIARFAGGRHANGNFPVLHGKLDHDASERAVAFETLLSGIRTARPDIDMLALERQRRTFEGLPNALLALAHTESPNIALSADLSGGFDRLLSGGSGKRRRKKHRSQVRKLEDAGGYRRFAAASRSEVDGLLDLFFALKRERLARMGIPDLFGDAHVQASFRRLFHDGLSRQPPPFVLHGLEVGGKVRAITGSSRTGDSIICEFSTFAEDELSGASPGDFLFYENILEACAEGLSAYDFSVGDEPYKRIWCDIETRHADVFVGLSAKGRVLVAAQFGLARAKRTVKQNPSLAGLARRLRRMLAARN